jgi:hypothetical protein
MKNSAGTGASTRTAAVAISLTNRAARLSLQQLAGEKSGGQELAVAA